MRVDVRFNTNYPEKSQFMWRVLIEGNEHLCHEVRIDCPTFTSSSFIEGHGLKFHISANAESFNFVLGTGEIKIMHIQ